MFKLKRNISDGPSPSLRLWKIRQENNKTKGEKQNWSCSCPNDECETNQIKVEKNS